MRRRLLSTKPSTTRSGSSCAGTQRGTLCRGISGTSLSNVPLVNHELQASLLTWRIPVITADSVPGITEVNLDNSLIDIVNNFHARMLSSAVIVAQSPHMEYVQISKSFGCGHDAYLSDEIIRLMKEVGPKHRLSSKWTKAISVALSAFVPVLLWRQSKKTGPRAG